jgi:hypothetical protein
VLDDVLVVDELTLDEEDVELEETVLELLEELEELEELELTLVCEDADELVEEVLCEVVVELDVLRAK